MENSNFLLLHYTLERERERGRGGGEREQKQNKIYNTDFPHTVIHFTLMLNIFKQQSLLEKMRWGLGCTRVV